MISTQPVPGVRIVSHIFNDWMDIPDVTNVSKVENGNVTYFDRRASLGEEFRSFQTTAVAYALKLSDENDNERVVAFGSATCFYDAETNPYIDDDDEDEFLENQKTRQLWIEGVVSIEKGCGTLIMQELERWLSIFAQDNRIRHKIVNLLAVKPSIGFYDKLGYVDCHTSPYWAGCADAIRMMKPLSKDADLSTTECMDYGSIHLDEKGFCWHLAEALSLDRIVIAGKYLNIPKGQTDLLNYAISRSREESFYRIADSNPLSKQKWRDYLWKYIEKNFD